MAEKRKSIKKKRKTAPARRREENHVKKEKKSNLPQSSFPNKAVQVWQAFTVH